MSDALEWLVENEPAFRKARLPALYSDFQGQRTTNPDGYQANVSAWRRGLASLVRAGLGPASAGAVASSPSPNHVILAADESLLRALESKQYGRPLALGAVIREASQQRDLIPLQDFLRAQQSIYYRSWAALPWDVAAWGARQLGLTGAFTFGGSDRLPGGMFVVVANLEAAAKAVLENTAPLTSRFERTFSKVQFQTEFRDSIFKSRQLSEMDMEVLLKFMARDQDALLYDGKTIKLKSPGLTETAITSEDETIASLKELTEYLEHQTAVLETRIAELTITAQQAVSKKNRVSALAALKSKKLAESSLQKRFATLNQLEEISAKIEQASDNVQLVKVMGASADVLKDLNAQVGGAERVDEVVDRLREQISQADEVSSILAEQHGGPAIDEGELDAELDAMLQEQRKQAEGADRARKQAEQRKEVEETAKRLAELDALRPTTERVRDEIQQEAEDLSGELSQMSLEQHKPQQQTES
ncbi:unnamed protein product [Discula destructiva]